MTQPLDSRTLEDLPEDVDALDGAICPQCDRHRTTSFAEENFLSLLALRFLRPSRVRVEGWEMMMRRRIEHRPHRPRRNDVNSHGAPQSV